MEFHFSSRSSNNVIFVNIEDELDKEFIDVFDFCFNYMWIYYWPKQNEPLFSFFFFNQNKLLSFPKPLITVLDL